MRKITNVIKAYYWGTFLFFFMDKVFGIDIRDSGFLDHSEYKLMYYLFCLVCLGLIYIKPGTERMVALIESSINITIVIVGSFLAFSNVDVNYFPESRQLSQRVVNFILSGGICLLSFYRAEYHFWRRSQYAKLKRNKCQKKAERAKVLP